MKTKSKKKSKSQTTQQPTGFELPFGKRLHPLAEKIPNMSAAEFVDLTADIERNGLRDPITVDHTGKLVVDGRHRLAACDVVKVKPEFKKLPKNVNVARFIVSRLTRRNLSTGQRAMIAADLLPEFEKEAKKRQGARTDIRAKLPESETGKATEQAAKAMNVSSRSVQEAKKLKAEAPEKADAVRKGHLKLHAARKDKKSGKKSPAKKAPEKILDDVQAEVNRQYRAKGLPVPGDEDEAPERPHAGNYLDRTTAPTQRVRSWLSAVKRFASETEALAKLAAESELSDDERQVVAAAVTELQEALEPLAMFALGGVSS